MTRPKKSKLPKRKSKFPKSLILRNVKESTWSEFHSIGKPNELTANQLMGQLLNRLHERGEIATLLKNPWSDLDDLAEVLQKMSWAEHARDRGFAHWSAMRLIDALKDVNGAPHLLACAQGVRYKLSFALLVIAVRCELLALQGAPTKFNEAKQAIYNAMALHKEFLEQDIESVVWWNDACAISLLCRIHIHEYLATHMRQEMAVLATATDGTFSAVVSKEWQAKGSTWKSQIPLPKRDAITKLAGAAIVRLQNLTKGRADQEGPLSWVGQAEGDPDLVFLRSWMPVEMKKWKDDYNRKNLSINRDAACLAAFTSFLPGDASRAEVIRDEMQAHIGMT